MDCKGIYDIEDFEKFISTFDDLSMQYKLLIELIFQTEARNSEAQSILTYKKQQ